MNFKELKNPSMKQQIKEGMEDRKNIMLAAMDVGQKKGVDAVVNYYDYARKVMGIVLTLSLLYFIFTWQPEMIAVCFFMWWNQVSYNQLWWKLKSIEYNYDQLVKEKKDE